MKMLNSIQLIAVLVGSVFVAGVADAASANVTQVIEPSRISLGETAQLTIAASGEDTPAVAPPMVAGLEFVAVGQSQQVESINGVTHSTTSVTYQVTPRQAGTFVIPGIAPGAQPLVLTVNPGAGRAAAVGGSPTMAAPPTGSGTTAATPDAAGEPVFVRLHISKHTLYVGETVPVDVQVGTRDGLVASINGLPKLNGGEFTLNKLSSQPQRTEEMIDGKPYRVFTWHSALAAVKPGTLSLTIDTPLAVRVRAPRPDMGLFGETGLHDLFNDPVFQNFFGAATEREVTVASSPTEFTVLALPTRDRPADFSGAVGQFSIRSDLSDDKVTVGDPVTLRLHVSGTGDFDRVNARMLHDIDRWRTYAPTSTFKPLDDVGYHGEKTFEQPIIAMQPGAQPLPPFTFSWFDPSTGQYAEARTSPLTVAIAPSPTESSVRRADPTPPRNLSTSSARATVGDGLRADQLIGGGGTPSLTPYYYQPVYLGIPSALILAFSGAGFWVRRRERSAHSAAGKNKPSLDPVPMLRLMDEAATAGDPELFFKAARTALQRNLASKWQLTPDAITLEEVNARLGAKSDVARVFLLAIESAYAGVEVTALEFQRWKRLVLGYINSKAMS